MAELKTPLTDWHVAHGAKMAPFAGWLMPIQYEGILVEHQHTRQHAGLFDICHMGEFRIRGAGADAALAAAVGHAGPWPLPLRLPADGKGDGAG